MKRSGWVGRFLATLTVCCGVIAWPAMAPARGSSATATKVDSRAKCTEVLVAQETPTVDPRTTQPPERAQNPPVTEAKSETDQYTLSHERYEKAVAYSRAGYAVYFVWVGLGLAAAWLP